MAGREIASPTFVAGPTTEVAAVDVYKKSNSAVVNDVPDLLPNPDSLPVAALRGGETMAKGLPAIDSIIKVGKSVIGALPTIANLVAPNSNATKALDLAKRIVGDNANVSSALRNAPAQFTTALNSVSSNKANITSTINGLTSTIQAADVGSARQLGTLMTQSLGVDPSTISIKDNGASVGLYSGLVSSGTELGMSGVFTTVANKVGNDTSTLTKIAQQVLPIVTKNGDIGTLNEMAQLLPTNTLKGLNPDILANTASNFSLPSGLTAKDLPSTFNTLLSTFSKVDTGWNSTTRTQNGISTPSLNITSLQSGSVDFKQLLNVGGISSNDPATKLYTLATNFIPKTVTESLRQMFPQTFLNNTSTVNAPVNNPQILRDLSGNNSLRTVGVIQSDIDQLMREWTAELNRQTAPIYQAAYAFKQADDLVNYDLKINEAKALQEQINDLYAARYNTLKIEKEKSQGVTSTGVT